jgi:PPK2 family polyphosphate:nucleotide phosphotransferase
MERYRVKTGEAVRLVEFDPGEDGGFEKDAAQEQLKALNDELEALQELLYAEHKRKVLVVLQGMDTSGKDGAIRHVFEGVNPQGVRVASFKAPTPEELDHDYLWRIHREAPGKGEIVVFNRSHYEDVLIVRVHQLVPEAVWRRRYEQIRAFERMLVEEGATVVKFFLHISKDEQKERLQERLKTPEKQWKFNVGDLKERKLWDDYQRAYEEALRETSTDWAPWYIVPSDRKWVRNLVISTVLVKLLSDLKMEYPQPAQDLSGVVID